MSNFLKIISLLLVFSIGCKNSQRLQEVTRKNAETKENYGLLLGDWRLTGYHAFMSPEDMEKIPDFSSLKVIYSIATNGNKLTVVRDTPKEENDFALPAGEHMIWANRSMLKIGESLYMYHIKDNELTLDSNYDPSYGPDGIVYNFVRN